MKSFEILQKLVLSDYNPLAVTLMYKPRMSLEIMERCAGGNFSYGAHDNSTKVRKKIRLNDIVVTPAMMNDFNYLASRINEWNNAGEPVDSIAVSINEKVY